MTGASWARCGRRGSTVGRPVPRGIRGAVLADDDPLRTEWDVALVGPHAGAALVARPCGDGEMEYAVVYEGDLVIEVARLLMSRTVPAPGAAMPGRGGSG